MFLSVSVFNLLTGSVTLLQPNIGSGNFEIKNFNKFEKLTF